MRSPLSLLLPLLLALPSFGCAVDVDPGRGDDDTLCGADEVCDSTDDPTDEHTTQSGADEICNGVDDDLDGRVDNLDAAGDGICDCLRIGILGRPGKWGQGSAFGDWLLERGSFVADLHDATLTAQTLADYDILIVNDVTDDGNANHGIDRAYSEDEVRALEAWVRGGGGLLSLIGYWSADAVTNVNSLLAPFGMAYGDRSILSGGTQTVEGWDREHALAQHVSAIGISNGNEPTGDGALFAWDEQSQVTAGLAQSGTTAVGAGKVAMWGDEWITYDALWTERPDYDIEQLWINLANWLTPGDACEIDVVVIIG